ncbi:DUF3934 domain-containing protein [Bacillus sp. UFRGS-B20]|nr:DUF3934 domain-containing protein [Bacillus sp. UFRGS-B20]
MSKTKAKPKKGVGQVQGSKGWNRWQSKCKEKGSCKAIQKVNGTKK